MPHTRRGLAFFENGDVATYTFWGTADLIKKLPGKQEEGRLRMALSNAHRCFTGRKPILC